MNKYGLSYVMAFLLASPAMAQDATTEGTLSPHTPPEIIAPVETSAPAPQEATAPAPQPEDAPIVKKSYGTPTADLIDDEVIAMIRSKVDTELTFFMVNNQNEKYQTYDDQKVAELDNQWVDERASDSKPLISATLSNPLSTYLTMVQAHSEGLITEIFVMDNKGLNVGQSNISSDYWQGDEAKWQKTYLVGPDTIFIDEAEYDDARKIWVVQINLSIADPVSGKAIGAVTVDINLNELQRRRNNGVAI